MVPLSAAKAALALAFCFLGGAAAFIYEINGELEGPTDYMTFTEVCVWRSFLQ
jgi:hypothetical protein